MLAAQFKDPKFEKEIRDFMKQERRQISAVARVLMRYALAQMKKNKMSFVDVMNEVEPPSTT